VSPLVALIGFLVFAARRLLTYLHLFQQEEYDSRRFLRWLVHTGACDRRLSLALAAVFIAQWALHGSAPPALFATLAGAACLGAAAIERDPRRQAKKLLVMTARAKRIYAIALALAAGIGVGAALTSNLVVTWIIAVQLVPLALVGANLILVPLEGRVQRRYWHEANQTLARIDPITIGVTGSYGKTSVKHILGHVLDAAAPTLITPGSVNTAMGIARVIRERLKPHHRYFVVEMGAYGIGSIARLCALTPPKLGIITAIGKAHYERFKSLDAVATAKFELAEAAVGNGGSVVLVADVVDFAPARDLVARHRERVVTVGSGDADLAITALAQEADGVVAQIRWRGRDYELRAPLYGLHHGRNIALVFAAACTLGLAPEDVVAALRSTPQIAHRLEVKRQPGAATFIDDAFNANPVGFAGALALLDTLTRPGGRRILVTPCMAELGEEHEAEHARIGRLAAEHVDVLLAVAPRRVEPLVRAFRAAASGGDIVECAGFAEARSWLDRNLAPLDTVLIENDLPDLLEKPLRL